MSALLGGRRRPGSCRRSSATAPSPTLNVAWTPDLIADHAGRHRFAALPAALSTIGRTVPDVLVGACWPAVFAVLGAATSGRWRPASSRACWIWSTSTTRSTWSANCPGRRSVLAVRAESGSGRSTPTWAASSRCG